MASTQCFLHHHALTTTIPTSTRFSSSSQYQVLNIKSSQLVCKAQLKDDGSLVSRRLALTVLIGAAAVGSKVSPADAAYGEGGMYIFCLTNFSPFHNQLTSIYYKLYNCLNNKWL